MYNLQDWGGQVRLPEVIDDKTESEGEADNLEEDRDFRHKQNWERENHKVLDVVGLRHKWKGMVAKYDYGGIGKSQMPSHYMANYRT